MDNFIFGSYVDNHSFLNRLDPRTKLISITIITMAFMWTTTPFQLGMNVLVLLWLYYLAQIKLGMALSSIKPILFILVFILIYHGIFPSHHLSLSHVNISGWLDGLQICIKIILMILVAALLSFTTSSTELAQGMSRLISPLRFFHVPVPQLSLMVTLTLQFVPIILNELNDIKTAQISRGVDFSPAKLTKKIQLHVQLIIPLLFAITNHANKMSDALDARGYATNSKITRYHETHFRKLDGWFSLAIIVYLAVILTIGSF